jgi:hypothetical protein
MQTLRRRQPIHSAAKPCTASIAGKVKKRKKKKKKIEKENIEKLRLSLSILL